MEYQASRPATPMQRGVRQGSSCAYSFSVVRTVHSFETKLFPLAERVDFFFGISAPGGSRAEFACSGDYRSLLPRNVLKQTQKFINRQDRKGPQNCIAVRAGRAVEGAGLPTVGTICVETNAVPCSPPYLCTYKCSDGGRTRRERKSKNKVRSGC